jgi:hypothetical protein
MKINRRTAAAVLSIGTAVTLATLGVGTLVTLNHHAQSVAAPPAIARVIAPESSTVPPPTPDAAQLPRVATAPPVTTSQPAPRTTAVPRERAGAPPAKAAIQPAGCVWRAEYDRYSTTLSGAWHISDQGGWGATDLDTGDVYISPGTPCAKLRSVMLHESMHVKQGRIYGGYDQAVTQLASYGGIEINADCAARLAGATWTNYAQRCTATQNVGAGATMSGQRAPGTS